MIQDELELRLRRDLAPQSLTIHDDSNAHRGHAEAGPGSSHFRVEVVSERFENLSRVARHRLVYHSCAVLMQAGIHALAIVALTPTEAALTKPPAQG